MDLIWRFRLWDEDQNWSSDSIRFSRFVITWPQQHWCKLFILPVCLKIALEKWPLKRVLKKYLLQIKLAKIVQQETVKKKSQKSCVKKTTGTGSHFASFHELFIFICFVLDYTQTGSISSCFLLCFLIVDESYHAT